MKIAVVCSSNQNRSMEAHNVLQKKGFDVKSFGTGTNVRIPGPSADEPNVFSFDTTYDEMYRKLSSADNDLYPGLLQSPPQDCRYTRNGMLHMLERNRRLKERPERFQECHLVFDLVITCEERIYDQVVEHLESRPSALSRPAHILNIDIADNHEDAMLGAIVICEICEMLRDSEDLDDDIERVIQEIEAENDRTLLHTVAFY